MTLKERVLHAFGFHDKLEATKEVVAHYHVETGNWEPYARILVCPTCGRRKKG